MEHSHIMAGNFFPRICVSILPRRRLCRCVSRVGCARLSTTRMACNAREQPVRFLVIYHIFRKPTLVQLHAIRSRWHSPTSRRIPELFKAHCTRKIKRSKSSYRACCRAVHVLAGGLVSEFGRHARCSTAGKRYLRPMRKRFRYNAKESLRYTQRFGCNYS